MNHPLILASESPRRADLLRQLGVEFNQCRPAIDETPQSCEAPTDYVRRIALAKAQAVWQGLNEPAWVLAADTAVVVDDMILGKPENRDQGLDMLRRLSGRWHQVLTGVALQGDSQTQAISVSQVLFKPLTEHDISAYWRVGESMDKAGAYAIQGRAAMFIERIEGSYSGVMGLPLFETAELLAKQGMKLLP
ncbi:MAG: Maf family protein [Methylococcales bacterium]|nr:Maf family protein [Methylococcales bacterium]